MAETDGRFDARRYLTRLKGKEYLEVKWRLVWLRTEHPNATIDTRLERLDAGPDHPLAVFSARVAIPDGGSATGWGQEEPKDFPDYLEKAETKALGRALAALGYGTQFCEDFDFAGGDEGRVVDAPVARRGPEDRGPPATDHGTPRGNPDDRALGASRTSDPQLRTIYAIAERDLGWTEANVVAMSKGAHGGRGPAELTRREASAWIDELKRLATAAKGRGGAGNGRGPA